MTPEAAAMTRTAVRARARKIDPSSQNDRATVAAVVAAVRSDVALKGCGTAADVGIAAKILVTETAAMVNPEVVARSANTYVARARVKGEHKTVTLHKTVDVSFLDAASALVHTTVTLHAKEAVCAQIELEEV